MSGRELVVRRVRARLLVLAHFSQRYGHDPRGVARLAAQAAEAFSGPVTAARDLDRIPVPRRAAETAGAPPRHLHLPE